MIRIVNGKRGGVFLSISPRHLAFIELVAAPMFNILDVVYQLISVVIQTIDRGNFFI